MNNKNLNNIRSKIDEVDLKLLFLIKKRTNFVNRVIKIKKFKKQIIDKKRIREVLINIKKKSIKEKIDPQITKRIWTTMISSFIDYEKKRFKKK